MKRDFILISTLVFVLVSSSTAFSQQLRVINDYGERIFLWQFLNAKWDQPPIFFQRGGDGHIDLKRPGKYYLLIRDSLNRDRDIGWKDLHAVHKIDPQAALGIRELIVSEKGIRTYTVWNSCTGRWESRQIETTVSKSAGPRLYVYSRGRQYYVEEFIQRFKPNPSK